MKNTTPKAYVRRKFPAAYSWMWADGMVCIYRPWLGGNLNMGCGKGYVKAWADAARNIRAGAV